MSEEASGTPLFSVAATFLWLGLGVWALWHALDLWAWAWGHSGLWGSYYALLLVFLWLGGAVALFAALWWSYVLFAAVYDGS